MSAHVSSPIELGHSLAVARSGRWSARAAIVVVAPLVAFWPVWFDYARRLRAGIDEPWGVVALITAIVLLIFHSTASMRTGVNSSRPVRLGVGILLPVSILIAIFALARQQLPPLAAAICAVTVLTFTLSRLRFNRRFDLPLYGLLLLSLPLSSALQFYLGYPMRYLTAALAAPLIRLTGFAVSQTGTVLQFGGQSIWIDAPCSGVKMLWTGLYLAFALAAFYRMGMFRTSVAAACSLLAVVLGNVVRSAALFFLEARILHVQPWGHTAIGLIAFALTAFAILWCVTRIARGASVRPETEKSPEARHSHIQVAALPLVLYVMICLAAAVSPLIFSGGTHAAGINAGVSAFSGWPASFEGQALTPQPLAAREQQFLVDFPGKVAKFSDGRRQFIFRWTNVATRKLHLSSDCFRGAGFTITPLSAMAKSSQSSAVQYSRFTATRGGETLLVSEQIHDEAGRTWPDASSWFWSASLGQTAGPWWAVTIVEAGDGRR